MTENFKPRDTDVFSVDFRFIERRFKSMDAEGSSIEGMRDLLNEDVKRFSSDLNSFIDEKVRTKYQDELRTRMGKLLTSMVSLGICEFKLATKDVKREDLTQGKRARGELARSISIAVAEAHPKLTADHLRPLIDDARAKADPPLDPISKSTLYAHLGARASKKTT